jgi:hypothetical protein
MISLCFSWQCGPAPGRPVRCAVIGAPVINGEIVAIWDARGGLGVVNGAGGLMAPMDACCGRRNKY